MTYIIDLIASRNKHLCDLAIALALTALGIIGVLHFGGSSMTRLEAKDSPEHR